MIRFSAQAYSFSKDPEFPLEWEDSAACSVRSGRFAVADGATQAYRSGEWAELLTEAYITGFPVPDGRPGPQRQKLISEWFGEQVRMWRERETPVGRCVVGQRCRAGATRVRDLRRASVRPVRRRRDLGGDRGRRFLHLPDQARPSGNVLPADFADSVQPEPASAHHRGRPLNGSLAALRSRTGPAFPGDIFVLATDAASEWLLSLGEYDLQSWGRVGFFGPGAFTHMMTELRAADAIEVDDAAVVVVAVH